MNATATITQAKHIYRPTPRTRQVQKRLVVPTLFVPPPPTDSLSPLIRSAVLVAKMNLKRR